MLKTYIDEEAINKIFGNQDVRKKYLSKLFEKIGCSDKIASKKAGAISQIESTWDYHISKDILRELFVDSEKYARCKKADVVVDKLIKEWEELELGELVWPFSAMNFDQHVHRLNNLNLSEKDKDSVLSADVIKFRRIKDINAKRNDYIEYLIFSSNENIIPTFGNRSGVDFYINGMPFDQKVSKSVGNDFIGKYGENYREIAIEHPELVAISLYENQDELRFGDESRLLITYLDDDVTSDDIKKCISKTNFDKPLEIEFNYFHSKSTYKRHITKCFVILLHK